VALLFAFRPRFALFLPHSPIPIHSVQSAAKVRNYVRILMHTSVTTGVKILPHLPLHEGRFGWEILGDRAEKAGHNSKTFGIVTDSI